MAKTNDSAVWYGELRTKRGNTVVIRDDELPPAASGRIYLYNTEREAMVEYDKTIVSDKLFELEAEQQEQAEKQYKSGWEAARKQLTKANGKSTADTGEASKPANDLALEDTDDSDDDFDDD